MIFVVTVICGCLFCVQACCKAYCIKQELPLRLIGYTYDQIDTILLVRYDANHQFNHVIDSLYSYSPFSGDTAYNFIENASLTHDYEIKIPATAQVFQLSSIETRKESCNCNPGNRYVVTGYTLNGSQYNQGYIDLVK